MNKFDKFISIVLLGLPVPAILMLVFWWVSVPIFKDNSIMYYLLVPAGIVIGIVIDLTVLRRYLLRLFSLPMAAVFALLAFYSLMIYGLFMGFPVFNILIGIIGVYIVTRSGQLRQAQISAVRNDQKRMNLFAFILLLLICIATTIMALFQESIGLELKLMLNLSFDVTPGMVWALIIVGTVLLLSLQYLISRLVYIFMMKKYTCRA